MTTHGSHPVSGSGAGRRETRGTRDTHATHDTHDTDYPHGDHGKLLRTFATLVGAVFLLVGILGFVPGITSDYDNMLFAGPESNAKLLGVFQVSVLHNIVHLLFGVAGLALARKPSTAFLYLVVGGVIYLLLFVYGLLVDHEHQANFVPLNIYDDFLHLGLGVLMIALGLIGRAAWRKKGHAASGTTTVHR